MSSDIPLDGLMKVKDIKGFALVSSEDGSILNSGGITPGNIDDLVAFTGSAAEIIADSCKIGGISSIKGIGRDTIVIVPFDGNYLGLVLEQNIEDIEEKVKESLEGLKKDVSSEIGNLLRDRSEQLNMLIREFVSDSDSEMWRGYIASGLSALSKDDKVKGLIKLEGMELKVGNSEGLNRDEINKFMKLLLDFIVKKALSEFGKQQTKIIVQKVIREISEKNK
ncbi:hypothetical protein JW879_09925 [candidate division WOR-3 bacterium]|nr:hypothetical protein [candidate division WOR-3 bacterium]